MGLMGKLINILLENEGKSNTGGFSTAIDPFNNGESEFTPMK